MKNLRFHHSGRINQKKKRPTQANNRVSKVEDCENKDLTVKNDIPLAYCELISQCHGGDPAGECRTTKTEIFAARL